MGHVVDRVWSRCDNRVRGLTARQVYSTVQSGAATGRRMAFRSPSAGTYSQIRRLGQDTWTCWEAVAVVSSLEASIARTAGCGQTAVHRV